VRWEHRTRNRDGRRGGGHGRRPGWWARVRTPLSGAAVVAVVAGLATGVAGAANVASAPPASAATTSTILGPPPPVCTGAVGEPTDCEVWSGDASVTVTPALVEPGGTYTITFTATQGGGEQADYVSLAGQGQVDTSLGTIGVADPSCPTTTQTVTPGSSISCTYTVPEDTEPSRGWSSMTIFFTVETFDTCNPPNTPTSYCVIGPAESENAIAVDGARIISPASWSRRTVSPRMTSRTPPPQPTARTSSSSFRTSTP
jgi:hypothetical protein